MAHCLSADATGKSANIPSKSKGEIFNTGWFKTTSRIVYKRKRVQLFETKILSILVREKEHLTRLLLRIKETARSGRTNAGKTYYCNRSCQPSLISTSQTSTQSEGRHSPRSRCCTSKLCHWTFEPTLDRSIILRVGEKDVERETWKETLLGLPEIERYVAKKEVYPLPKCEDTLHTMSTAAFFAHLDLVLGCWQISIEEKDRKKTLFFIADGHYQFIRMPCTELLRHT